MSDLLGSSCPSGNENTNEIAAHLERINEQLAIRNRRTKTMLKIIGGVIVGIIVLNVILILTGIVTFDNIKTETTEKHYQIDS